MVCALLAAAHYQANFSRPVRCGVSFLSIQDPYSSRPCARCGKEVLKAEALRQGVQQPERPAEATTNLLDVLLDKFDTCEYCGGKFRA
jgi:DNA-directed RNA polymerase subunit RPC12/RpoP